MAAAGKKHVPSGKGAKSSTLRTALIRTVAWIVAIPALCATVIVGGAVPLYLLLPDAKPKGTESASLDPAPKPAAVPKKVASAAPAPSADPAKPVPAATEPAVAEEPPAETAEEASPAPEPMAAPAKAPAEPQIAAVIPTPRPEPPPAPKPTRPAVTEDASREEASLPMPAPQAGKPPLEASARGGGGRAVILRTVTLRSSPRGREVGTLPQGTPVVVGPCDGWCEVSGNGTRGWVHSSFLADSLPARRDVVQARRIERREPARDRDEDWLDEGLGYDGDDRPVVIRRPQWAYEEERPRVLRRYPAPPPRYDDPYEDPYY